MLWAAFRGEESRPEGRAQLPASEVPDSGRAYLEAGDFIETDSELAKCLKRRGEGSAGASAER